MASKLQCHSLKIEWTLMLMPTQPYGIKTSMSLFEDRMDFNINAYIAEWHKTSISIIEDRVVK